MAAYLIQHLSLVTVSLLGAHTTYWLRHRTRLGPIRAVALASLAFLAVTAPWHSWFLTRLQAAFYGACFVGMSEAGKLSERHVAVAALIFSVLFCVAGHLPLKLGGGLGAAAFASCLLVYYLGRRRIF